MILAIFIISITLGAEPELKVRIIHFCSSADCTSVFCSIRIRHCGLDCCRIFALKCLFLHLVQIFFIFLNWSKKKIRIEINVKKLRFATLIYAIVFLRRRPEEKPNTVPKLQHRQVPSISS